MKGRASQCETELCARGLGQRGMPEEVTPGAEMKLSGGAAPGPTQRRICPTLTFWSNGLSKIRVLVVELLIAFDMPK